MTAATVAVATDRRPTPPTATTQAPRRTAAGAQVLTLSPASRSRAGRPTSPRPRLLLPPCAEPASTPTPMASPPLGTPATSSVLSPVTERLWPVPTLVREEQPVRPDPTDLCGSVVLAAVEAVGGRRPLSQLARWVSPAVYDALADARAACAPHTAPSRRTTVRATLVSRLSPTVAEASVVVHDGARVRAAAVRLEVHRDHWRATALQIG